MSNDEEHNSHSSNENSYVFFSRKRTRLFFRTPVNLPQIVSKFSDDSQQKGTEKVWGYDQLNKLDGNRSA